MASPRSPGMLSKADEEIKKTVESYFKQLKDGCGARSCGNEWCRSNANCAVSLVRTLSLRVLLSEHRPTRYTPIGLARTLPKSPCWPSSWRLPARRSVANSYGGQYSRANLCKVLRLAAPLRSRFHAFDGHFRARGANYTSRVATSAHQANFSPRPRILVDGTRPIAGLVRII